MSNIKFKHNLYVRWTFKLVRKTFHIHLHEETDVKFLGCIDNQIFFAMKLRHLDPPPPPAPNYGEGCGDVRHSRLSAMKFYVLRPRDLA